jgi:hypothetical protein
MPQICHVRRALFVADHPHGFGLYQERASNVFKPGEALVTDAEPVGYGAKDAGNSLLQFGFAVDFLIKSPDGQILTGQQDFARLTQQSYVRNLEFMPLLTLDVSGAPPGDYVGEYKLRDISGDKTTSFELPFKIAPARMPRRRSARSAAQLHDVGAARGVQRTLDARRQIVDTERFLQ